jgi:methionine-rich copper-binding protein CopC
MPGAVLATAPLRLDIFTAVDLSASDLNAIDVRGADAREVDQRDVTLDAQNPRHLSVGLQPGLGAGRYVATFVAAHDSQTVDRGQFSFYIGLSPTSAERSADARLNVDVGMPQVAPAGKDPTAPLAVGIAVGIAGAISAGTVIALRRRGRRESPDW